MPNFAHDEKGPGGAPGKILETTPYDAEMPRTTMLRDLAVHSGHALPPVAEARRSAALRMVTFGGLWVVGGAGLGATALALSGGMVVVGVAALAVAVGLADLARGAASLRS